MVVYKRIPCELEEQGYRVIKKLSLSGTSAFIIGQFKKHRKLRQLVRIILATEIAVIVVLFVTASLTWGSWQLSVRNILEVLLITSGLMLLLIPVHEGIHALFFKLAGAQKVQFGIEWRQGLVYAAADRTPLTYRQYRIIALAPFVIIGITLLVWISLSDSLLMQMAIVLAFLIHLNCCGGDWVMMLYFRQYRYREVITIDDLENRVTYFLEKAKDKCLLSKH